MNFENDITKCLEVLDSGGTILYPTDTIWGIGCDATNELAVDKIYHIKQRPSQKALVVLVASERDVMKYVAQLDLEVFDYLNNASKPTTVIYEGAIGLAGNLIAEDGSVAVRVVKDEFCRALIKRFKKPIVSTSANMSGSPSPSNFREIDSAIIEQVDYTVEHRQQERIQAQSSSIIKWRNGSVEVIRP
jgi:L-threonylcarbamoyladenylate synthase